MTLLRSRRILGRQAASALLLLALALPTGCYRLRGGGGLPEEIRTMYIQPFENSTPQFELGQQLFNKLSDRLPRALGIRPAGEDHADSWVRGKITRYEDAAQNYRPGEAGGRVTVELHQVQITVTVELINRKNNTIIWEQSVTGRGEYRPASEQDVTARDKALDHILQQIIDGAQSQW